MTDQQTVLTTLLRGGARLEWRRLPGRPEYAGVEPWLVCRTPLGEQAVQLTIAEARALEAEARGEGR